jgi:F-type H+-transporting ATPase subunit b
VLLVCISTFLIVVFCKHFFWNKLLDFIKKRQALIQDNIDSSARMKAEAQALKQEYEDQLHTAGAKANEIIDSARSAAQLEKEQIITAAKAQAANIEQSAKDEIETEKRKAQTEMKDAITDVAIAAAGAILQSEVDAEKQQQILDSVIEQADAETWKAS